MWLDAETQMAGRKIPVFPSGDSSKMDIIGYQWRYNDIDIYDICIYDYVICSTYIIYIHI